MACVGDIAISGKESETSPGHTLLKFIQIGSDWHYINISSHVREYPRIGFEIKALTLNALKKFDIPNFDICV